VSTGVNGAIVGLQWGDEGKGKLVDLVMEDYDGVVRFNGGANAGHSVVIGEERYALHLLPSGVLRPGKRAIIANGVNLEAYQPPAPPPPADAPPHFVFIGSLTQRWVGFDKLITLAQRAYREVPREERERVGITEGMLRLSVGLEETADILADLQTANAEAR